MGYTTKIEIKEHTYRTHFCDECGVTEKERRIRTKQHTRGKDLCTKCYRETLTKPKHKCELNKFIEALEGKDGYEVYEGDTGKYATIRFEVPDCGVYLAYFMVKEDTVVFTGVDFCLGEMVPSDWEGLGGCDGLSLDCFKEVKAITEFLEKRGLLNED